MGGEKLERREPESFIKVLMPGYREKLDIPPVFSRGVSEEQVNRELAWIRSGVGKTWEFRLQRDPSDGGLCFVGEEWMDFVEVHGLQVGYFLCFRHEGGMKFSVLVFDYSTCNKTYVPVANDEVDDSRFEDKTTRKRVGHDREEKEQGPEEAPTKSRHFEATICYSRKQKYSLQIPTKFVYQHKLWRLREAQVTSSRGAWRIKFFHYVTKGRNAARFCGGWKTCLAENELIGGDICLFELIHVKKGVAVFHMTRKKEQDSNSKEVSATRENDKVVVDCEDNPSLCDHKPASTKKLSEYGPSRDEDEHCNVMCDNEDKTPEEAVARGHVEQTQKLAKAVVRNPCFEVTMSKSSIYEKCYMTVPIAFMKKHNLLRFQQAQLTTIRGKWLIQLQQWLCPKYKRATFSNGWKEFRIKNELMVGDTYVFELIRTENDVAVFHMARKRERDSDAEDTAVTTKKNTAVIDADDDNPSLCEVKTSEKVVPRDYTEKKQRLEKAIAGNRYFQVTIKKSNVYKDSYMGIPIAFLKKHNLFGTVQAQLISSRGHWYVHIRYVSGYARISRGWEDFQIKNDVRIGDNWTFILIHTKRNMAVFHVIKKSKQDSNFKEVSATRENDKVVVNCEDNSSLCDYKPLSTEKFSEHGASRDEDERSNIMYDNEHKAPEEKVAYGHVEQTQKLAKAVIRNPCFEVTMNKSNIYNMNMPIAFVKKHNLQSIQQAQLTTSRGKWPIQLQQRLCTGYKRACFSSGWKEFFIKNELMVGNTCVFELIRIENDVAVFHMARKRKQDSDAEDTAATTKKDMVVIDAEDDNPS